MHDHLYWDYTETQMKHHFLDCTKCGKCCLMIGSVILQAEDKLQHPEKLDKLEQDILNEIVSFPHHVNSDGSCSKLYNDMCSIFDHRPDICNIERMWSKHWFKLGVTRQQHYKNTTKLCKEYAKLKPEE
jgi:uncharacterized protein